MASLMVGCGNTVAWSSASVASSGASELSKMLKVPLTVDVGIGENWKDAKH